MSEELLNWQSEQTTYINQYKQCLYAMIKVSFHIDQRILVRMKLRSRIRWVSSKSNSILQRELLSA